MYREKVDGDSKRGGEKVRTRLPGNDNTLYKSYGLFTKILRAKMRTFKLFRVRIPKEVSNK